MSSATTAPHAQVHAIVEWSSAMLLARAGELQVALKDSFGDSDFMPGFGVASPWTHTEGVLNGLASGEFRHVLALDGENAVIGAVLCVPAVRHSDEPADPGWFFVHPEVRGAQRGELANELVRAAHEIARGADFERVVTKMGTRSGAAYLMRRHGYRREPAAGEANRYVREL